LKFSEDTIVYAGPHRGCERNINEIIVTPIAVADKLKTYRGPVSVEINPANKFVHLAIAQEDTHGPVFDMQNKICIKTI
jgi:hypothetical protein